jgi:hypothetical protein
MTSSPRGRKPRPVDGGGPNGDNAARGARRRHACVLRCVRMASIHECKSTIAAVLLFAWDLLPTPRADVRHLPCGAARLAGRPLRGLRLGFYPLEKQLETKCRAKRPGKVQQGGFTSGRRRTRQRRAPLSGIAPETRRCCNAAPRHVYTKSEAKPPPKKTAPHPCRMCISSRKTVAIVRELRGKGRRRATQ